MIDVKGPYRNGAVFVALSALLHAIAPILGGFSQDALTLFVFGVVYAGIALGLFQGMRWLVYIAFLMMIGGSIVALSYVWALGPVPSWIYTGIFAANWLAATGLFLALWKTPLPKMLED
ncbi:MAG: hypothetical protein AAF393_00920 [Pseudomonadota bacterium]